MQFKKCEIIIILVQTVLYTECPSLDDIPDGFVMLDDLKINSTAVYNCTDGFILVGESTRLCTDDLTWSGEIPTCLGIIYNIHISIYDFSLYNMFVYIRSE